MSAITELKTIIKQLQSINADTSMEEAFDMVENLTEELIVKEKKLMKLEKENKEIEKERVEFFIDKEIYEEIGYRIFSDHPREEEYAYLQDEFLYSVPARWNFKWKMRAVEIFMDTCCNHEWYHPFNYENVIYTEKEVWEKLKDDVEYDEDNIDRKSLVDKIIAGEEDFGGLMDELDIDWCCQLPWYNDEGENMYIVRWSL